MSSSDTVMMPPAPRDVAAEIEQGTAQLTMEQEIGTMLPGSGAHSTEAAQPADPFAAAMEEEIPGGMERSPSLAKLAALLKSPSLEGLQSWETIHPNLLPEFTPRFTVTADPSAQPQLQGDVNIDVNGLPAGPMPTAPGPIATAGVPVVATPAMSQEVAVKAELVPPPDVNGAFAMPPAKAIQKRRPSLPKEAPSADVPDTVEITVPAEGWKVGEQVIVTLPGEEQQQVRVTISPQTAMAAVPGTPFRLPVAEGGALYRVELRGGRTNWVPRKKMLTILRNRKSAAACRSTIVELKAELARCQLELNLRDQIAELLHAPATPVGDGRPLDLSGDGLADAVGYDTNGDGRVDALDTNGDGKIDSKIMAINLFDGAEGGGKVAEGQRVGGNFR